MGVTHLLVREQRIDRPVGEVFAFFAGAVNLERITPPFLRFEVLTPAPIPMRRGTMIEYRLRLHGIPIRWKTVIEQWHADECFVDRQLSGPYALWHHTHTFAADGEQTVMRDTVRYRIGFGPLGDLAHRLFVRRDVERIFEHRHAEVDRIFASRPAVAA